MSPTLTPIHPGEVLYRNFLNGLACHSIGSRTTTVCPTPYR